MSDRSRSRSDSPFVLVERRRGHHSHYGGLHHGDTPPHRHGSVRDPDRDFDVGYSRSRRARPVSVAVDPVREGGHAYDEYERRGGGGGEEYGYSGRGSGRREREWVSAGRGDEEREARRYTVHERPSGRRSEREGERDGYRGDGGGRYHDEDIYTTGRARSRSRSRRGGRGGGGGAYDATDAADDDNIVVEYSDTSSLEASDAGLAYAYDEDDVDDSAAHSHSRTRARRPSTSAVVHDSAVEYIPAGSTAGELGVRAAVDTDMDPNASVYTRADGALVVRSRPAEVEIVEVVEPVRVPVEVPVARNRSRSRGVGGGGEDVGRGSRGSLGREGLGRRPSRASRRRRRKSLDLGDGRAPAFKRLVVACDGTWLNADNGMNNGELAIPSNVTRISRAIRPMSKDGIPQVVYYQFGVGSRGNVLDKIVGGTTGSGIEENVREAYAFLSNNYSPGDEIILIGFSRGAFTARSVAGLICEIGMLTKKGLPAFVPIFEDVQHRRDHKYKDKNPTIPFSNKPNACDPRYREELERRGLTDLDVTVKAIGVWDTVGSLGAPRIGWLTRVGIQPTQSHEMKFYDTKLSNSIEHAFQALALDEKRAAFAPAVWEKPRGNTTVLRQVWFPGVHSNIGGGYDDQQLANITLAWMAAQLSPFLDFRTKYLLAQDDAAARYYVKRHETPRPWAFGTIPNSAMGLYALAGTTARCPGTYHAVDPHTGRVTPRPLRDTCEYVHPSVRARLRLGGPGEADKGKYSAGPLTRAWRLVVGESEGEDGAPSVVWRPVRGREVESGAPKVLPESPLWRLERELCARDPETFDYVVAPPRTRGRDKAHARRRRSRSRAGGEGRDRSEWRRSVG